MPKQAQFATCIRIQKRLTLSPASKYVYSFYPYLVLFYHLSLFMISSKYLILLQAIIFLLRNNDFAFDQTKPGFFHVRRMAPIFPCICLIPCPYSFLEGRVSVFANTLKTANLTRHNTLLHPIDRVSCATFILIGTMRSRFESEVPSDGT